MKTSDESSNKKTNLLQGKSSKGYFLLFLLLVFLIVIAVLIRPALIFQTKNPSISNSSTPQPDNPAPIEASPALGPINAPVTIIEYADFGCSTCWYWHNQGILNQLRTKYGDQIRFIWRDFPVITLLSPRAAEAGQCAHQQGRFWDFHNLVYKSQGEIDSASLQSYAAALNLDLTAFSECTTSRYFRDRVNAQQTEAFGHGFTGTPAFLVNGKKLIGPVSLEVFSSLIDPLITASNQSSY